MLTADGRGSESDRAGYEERATEEMEALEAIFGDDFANELQEQGRCQVSLSSPSALDAQSMPRVTLRFIIPKDYPSKSVPTVEVLDTPWLTEADAARLVSDVSNEMMTQAGANTGEDQEWLWCLADSAMQEHRRVEEQRSMQLEQQQRQQREQQQWQREQQDRQRELRKREALAQQGGREEAAEQAECGDGDREGQREQALGIHHGEAVTVRRSVFQAHLASVTSVESVKAVMDVLLQNKKIASATHNIMAYRIQPSASADKVHQDWDDDGETAAGSRLLHLLQVTGATNVVVVVSRWFGGILLGPERFRHINNAARSLLDACGYCNKEAIKK